MFPRPLSYPMRRVYGIRKPVAHARTYTSETTSEKSAHARWYSDIVPGMVPVAILGSTVYLALQLLQTHLSREKYLDEARARVQELEAEVDALRDARSRKQISAPMTGGGNLNTRRWFSWG